MVSLIADYVNYPKTLELSVHYTMSSQRGLHHPVFHNLAVLLQWCC